MVCPNFENADNVDNAVIRVIVYNTGNRQVQPRLTLSISHSTFNLITV